MDRFNKTFDLLSIAVLTNLLSMVGDTHQAIQQLEAGIEADNDEQAEATFLFLDLIGYLPNTIEHKGKAIPVIAKGLRSVSDIFYFVDYELDTGEISTFPLLGPLSGAAVKIVDVKNLETIIKHAFPKAVIQMTTGTSKSGETVYHTTVRPAFMQDEIAQGFPVESGSAECSNASVSLMQATTRMIAAHVIGAYGAALAIENMRLKRGPSKTMADIAKEKYGREPGDFNDLLAAITSPNGMFADLFNPAPEDRKAARQHQKKAALAAGYSGASPIGGKARSELDDFVKSLEALGIDVKVIKI